MFSAKTKGFDESIYTEKIQRVTDLPKVLEDKALGVVIDLESELVNIYATAPPRDSSTFVWSLDKEKNKAARGWWFANLKEGKLQTDGKHHKRTGKPPYSVVVNLSQGQRAISMQVKMNNPKMRFPFGGLNGVDTRNPTHKRTGWVFASPLVDKALENARSQLLADMSSYLEEI